MKHSSASDYSIYTIRSESGSLLAVVIETKLDARSTDVRAQVCPLLIGTNTFYMYMYIAITILVLVLQPALFPYTAGDGVRCSICKI